MTRPHSYPLTQAIIDTLEATGRGVGHGEAPDTEVPYLVVSRFSSPEAEGPMSDNQADAEDTFQVTSIGSTALQSERLLDEARSLMTRQNIQDAIDSITQASIHFTDRYIMGGFPLATISGQQIREERGIPEPVFQTYDQYVIKHTPVTS